MERKERRAGLLFSSVSLSGSWLVFRQAGLLGWCFGFVRLFLGDLQWG